METKHIHNHKEYFKVDFLKNQISRQDDFGTVADIFALLADPTRLKIFWLLCHSKECVINIAQILKMTNPAVSHHLKILREAGLIESYRDEREVFYTVSTGAKSQALHSIIEKLMSINCPDFDNRHEQINENSDYLENQVGKIKKVHDYLTQNLSKRITIEELSKQFAMNPTTLKTVFKDVYGNSLAAHIKEHRMEKAAELLVQSQLPINQIAQEVGYESQSKFSAVFKDFYKCSPMEYKKKHSS
ncbi:MAG: metalloregulator ArsR/SmtB family transcription factor [Treponema sp.]|nr:metalloregulator ArsR/SmtB family transcription factor [Treponema sp.]